jgi:hypothetical protein
MLEAVSTSETSANFYGTTRHNIPKGCHLHTRRREDMNSHEHCICFVDWIRLSGHILPTSGKVTTIICTKYEALKTQWLIKFTCGIQILGRLFWITPENKRVTEMRILSTKAKPSASDKISRASYNSIKCNRGQRQIYSLSVAERLFLIYVAFFVFPPAL